MKDIDHVLRAEVAKEFDCAHATVIITPWGEKVDLRTIDLAKARELSGKGLKCLKLKVKSEKLKVEDLPATEGPTAMDLAGRFAKHRKIKKGGVADE